MLTVLVNDYVTILVNGYITALASDYVTELSKSYIIMLAVSKLLCNHISKRLCTHVGKQLRNPQLLSQKTENFICSVPYAQKNSETIKILLIFILCVILKNDLLREWPEKKIENLIKWIIFSKIELSHPCQN